MTVTYTFARGETLVIGVTDSEAVEGGESDVTCKIKPLRIGAREPVFGTPPAASLTVSFRAAEGETEKGWTMMLTKEASAALEPGYYQLDVAILDGVMRVITDPATVRILEPSSL